MGSGYLCHLTFIFSKFTLKNFIFFEIVSDTMVSLSIFHFLFICLALTLGSVWNGKVIRKENSQNT